LNDESQDFQTLDTPSSYPKYTDHYYNSQGDEDFVDSHLWKGDSDPTRKECLNYSCCLIVVGKVGSVGGIEGEEVFGLDFGGNEGRWGWS
jgi:hypothetical protein